jgi:iron(III) transport system substrate-binding protein
MTSFDNDKSRGWTRRGFNTLVSGSVLASVGGALLRPALADQPKLIEEAKKEGQVAVYGDSSMVPQLVEGFKKKYPDIKVTSVPGGGWQSYNRMMSEKSAGRMVADVLCANDDTLLFGYREGVFGNLDTTAGYPKDAVSDTGYVITQRMLTPIIYNSDATKNLPLPKDWEDFTKFGDEWKDLIISSDPRNSGTALCVLIGLYQGLGKEKTQAILDAWKRLDTEIAPNTGVQVAKMTSGERPLTVTMHMAFYKRMREQGAPAAFILPTSGSMMQVGAMAVPKDAPHPRAGALFIDFVMSRDGAEIMAANGTYPSSTDEIAPTGFPARKSIKLMPAGPADTLRDRDMVIEMWKSAMGIS